MAEFEQKDLSGVLFKNDKNGNERAPDYQGNCMIDGTKLRVSAWVKEGAKGKFMSLAFSKPFVKEGQASEPVIKPIHNDDFEDMPF
jgi:hypothetical protein